jgi:hypothetical protein
MAEGHVLYHFMYHLCIILSTCSLSFYVHYTLSIEVVLAQICSNNHWRTSRYD